MGELHYPIQEKQKEEEGDEDNNRLTMMVCSDDADDGYNADDEGLSVKQSRTFIVFPDWL